MLDCAISPSLAVSEPDLISMTYFVQVCCHLPVVARSGRNLSANQPGNFSMIGNIHGNCLRIWPLHKLDFHVSEKFGTKSEWSKDRTTQGSSIQ